jgi:hypothetical protein
MTCSWPRGPTARAHCCPCLHRRRGDRRALVCRRRGAERALGAGPGGAGGHRTHRSSVYHGWITLSATLLGFAIGTGLGILLAIGIVHNRAMDQSVMPWAIASQTIPILAIAPMIIVVLNSVGDHGAPAQGDHLGLPVVLSRSWSAW